MTTTNRNKANRENEGKIKTHLNFSKVGGLSHHINVLRELIVFPLIFGRVYSHFNIKPARGVLFYGPPGTGKTYIAGALASELNQLGIGKVSFFHRKGADILDKWVGESERKLRKLFDKAARSRPAVIFFDELDGLAPERSTKNEQVHSSIVATLLVLMDGLDKMPGVIIIAATNRIDAVDPALRRPGRFDRELYFPLPSMQSRKEILQVHMQNWKHQLDKDALNNLAELTSGYSGSDLQALCAQAVMCSVKKAYPNITNITNPKKLSKINVDPERLRVEEGDFLKATLSIPASNRNTCTLKRKLSSFIEPLLKNQLLNILDQIKLMWPHFLQTDNKYFFGQARYAGRVLILGTNMDGLNNHLLPAILHFLEHLPLFVIESPSEAVKNVSVAGKNMPCVLLMSKIDSWWNISECSLQVKVISDLEDLQAGNPILLIATCGQNLPFELADYFYNSNTVIVRMVNPTLHERENFLAPLFFSDSNCSVYYVYKMRTVFENTDTFKKSNEKHKTRKCEDSQQSNGPSDYELQRSAELTDIPSSFKKDAGDPQALKRKCHYLCHDQSPPKIPKMTEGYPKGKNKLDYTSRPKHKLSNLGANPSHQHCSCHDCVAITKPCNLHESVSLEIPLKPHVSTILTDLLSSNRSMNRTDYDTNKVEMKFVGQPDSCSSYSFEIFSSYEESPDKDKNMIYRLWHKATRTTSKDFSVGHMELLYDMIVTCINMYSEDFPGLILNLDKLLTDFEKPSSG